MMRILHGIDGLRHLPAGIALSIGNYDGVHRGHQALVRRLHELSTVGAAVATFEPHPLTVLRPAQAPPRITPPSIKRRVLDTLGVSHLVELPPTPDVLNLPAEQFWQILRDQVRPSHLVEGPTFNFGKNRGGNVDRLRQWAQGSGVGVHVLDPQQVALLDCSLVEVSSSLVRFLIAHGRVRDAGICLSRPFALAGKVVQGQQRGAKIGFPTANLHTGDQVIPCDGVYAGRCTLDGQTHPAAVSIGTNPTFGDPSVQVEAHLIDFSGDLYGRTIEIELLDWLRDQRTYCGVEPLVRQIERDVAEARRMATGDTRCEPIVVVP